jgi:hypothetical protein
MSEFKVFLAFERELLLFVFFFISFNEIFGGDSFFGIFEALL